MLRSRKILTWLFLGLLVPGLSLALPGCGGKPPSPIKKVETPKFPAQRCDEVC